MHPLQTPAVADIHSDIEGAKASAVPTNGDHRAMEYGFNSNDKQNSTLTLANTALKAFRKPHLSGAPSGIGGSGAAAIVKSFISITERLIGFLDSGKDKEFVDPGARADVQVALRAAIDVAASVDSQWSDSNNAEIPDRQRPRNGLRSMGPRRRSRSAATLLTAEDKAVVSSSTRRLETHLQVASYRLSHAESSTTEEATSGEYSSTRSGAEVAMGGGKLRRNRSVAKSAPGAKSDPLGSADPLQTSIRDLAFPWEINQVLYPVTPLRERGLRQHQDGTSIPCMWKGKRVVVKIVRGNWERFREEADFLWGLSSSENVQTMLGAYFEPEEFRRSEESSTTKGPSGNSALMDLSRRQGNSVGVGYIVLDHVYGISLDKAVRERRLDDTAAQLRVLDKILSVLCFTAALPEPCTHQELHPGNVILVLNEMPENLPGDEIARRQWESRPDGTLRMSNHVVKVLDFANASDARKGGRVARGKAKSKSLTKPEPLSVYTAPEKRIFRRRMINQTVLASDRNTEQREATRKDSEQNISEHAGGRREGDGGSEETDELKTRTMNQAGLNTGVEAGITRETLEKVDVWSVGWIMYYLVTGKHPQIRVPSSMLESGKLDSENKEQAYLTARLSEDLSTAPRRIQDIVLMCTYFDPERRATLRDVSKAITALFESMVFEKGVSILHSAPSDGMAMMDKACGIKAPKSELYRDHKERTEKCAVNPIGLMCMKQYGPGLAPEEDDDDALWNYHVSATAKSRDSFGTTATTYRGLAALPLVVVRRVEWEVMAKCEGTTEDEMAIVRRTLVNHVWSKADVKNGPGAVAYLTARDSETLGGNAAAKSALGWIYRWGIGAVQKDVGKAISLWDEAYRMYDAEAANGLGLLYHHGRSGLKANGTLAEMYYKRAIELEYAAAAVNMGVMLHDGAANLKIDGPGCKEYYSLASSLGDAVAANNLGLLHQFGAPGIDIDGIAALRHYELAIVRGERNHARRNLGELLWEGSRGVVKNPEAAVQNFVIALLEGDEIAKKAAETKLTVLMKSRRGSAISERTLSQVKKALSGND